MDITHFHTENIEFLDVDLTIFMRMFLAGDRTSEKSDDMNIIVEVGVAVNRAADSEVGGEGKKMGPTTINATTIIQTDIIITSLLLLDIVVVLVLPPSLVLDENVDQLLEVEIELDNERHNFVERTAFGKGKLTLAMASSDVEVSASDADADVNAVDSPIVSLLMLLQFKLQLLPIHFPFPTVFVIVPFVFVGVLLPELEAEEHLKLELHCLFTTKRERFLCVKFGFARLFALQLPFMLLPLALPQLPLPPPLPLSPDIDIDFDM